MKDGDSCRKPGCDGQYWWSRGCGAAVCDACDDHAGLCRCFCGWSASGGNGYRELVQMGEQIEEDY